MLHGCQPKRLRSFLRLLWTNWSRSPPRYLCSRSKFSVGPLNYAFVLSAIFSNSYWDQVTSLSVNHRGRTPSYDARSNLRVVVCDVKTLGFGLDDRIDRVLTCTRVSATCSVHTAAVKWRVRLLTRLLNIPAIAVSLSRPSRRVCHQLIRFGHESYVPRSCFLPKHNGVQNWNHTPTPTHPGLESMRPKAT